MRFRGTQGTGAFRGTRRIVVAVAAVAFGLGLCTGFARAGDVAPQSSNGLEVSGSNNQLLPQTQATGQSLLSGLHISGYANELGAMWTNPTGLQEYTHSRNNLAVARTLLQVDENWRLNENNTLFGREWFVYEPPYSFNSANNPYYVDYTHASYGSMMNGFYNNYQVRDFWWQNKFGPLTTFVGNQIVVWGQSLAFRVGDVVNPTDTCWAFGFANLEQSRNAQWMLHPILNLPEFGPFSSNFIEAVIEPGFAPVWWPEQTGDPYHKYRSMMTAGRGVPCTPAASHGPSARFDISYPNTPVFGFTAPTTIPGAGGPNFNGNDGAGNVLITSPGLREFMECGQLSVSVIPSYNYFDRVGNRKYTTPACRLGYNKHNNPISPIGDATLFDTGYWHIPGMQPRNWNDGLRLHTLLGATELTAIYYNDNTSGGDPWSLRWTPHTNLWNYSEYDIQEMGMTADRPLPVPESLGEYLPLVGRTEAVYLNHVNFESNIPGDQEAQRYSDEVKWMAALDVDQAYAPWLTETGNLTTSAEVVDTIVMDDPKGLGFSNAIAGQESKNGVQALFSLGTSWYWSDVVPNWAMIYDPRGESFALFPTLALNPPWTKKYFVQFGVIQVLSGYKENSGALGLFKGQNMVNAQLQYNFDLM